MNAPQNKLFKSVDAMKVRQKFGNMIDKVRLTNRRYVIKRRGKPTALLVPITDQSFIQAGVSGTTEELNTVYSAFDEVCGTIDDPSMQDASQTIDEYVYDEPETMEKYDE